MSRDAVVDRDEIVVVLDWKSGKESPGNREMVSYARAHGCLVGDPSGEAQSMVVTKDKVYLTRASAATLKARLQSNIVSPAGGDMVR